jgi:hypothetical protein
MNRIVVFSSDKEKCAGGERGTLEYTIVRAGGPDFAAEGRLINGELWIYDRFAPADGFRFEFPPKTMKAAALMAVTLVRKNP